MTLWIIFAVMTAAAFTFLLRPFLKSEDNSLEKSLEADIYKDQLKELERDVEDGLVTSEDQEAAKTEISRRILDSLALSNKQKPIKANLVPHRKLIMVLVFLVPAISLSLYLLVGQPHFEDSAKQKLEKPSLSGTETLEELIGRVEAHLKKNPDDLKGWLVLERTYSNMGRKKDAKKAFENIARLSANRENIEQLPPGERSLMIRAMVAGLHQKLREDGNNLEGWQRLIRAYMVMGQKKEAIASYKEAKKALSEDKAGLKTLSSFVKQTGLLN